MSSQGQNNFTVTKIVCTTAWGVMIRQFESMYQFKTQQWKLKQSSQKL